MKHLKFKTLFFSLLLLCCYGQYGYAQGCSSECQVEFLDISTGLDITGSVLTSGAGDPLWTLTQVPAISAWSVPRPAFVVTPNTAWDSGPNSAWISGENSSRFGDNNCPDSCGTCTQLPYRFERCFCVCEPTELIIQFEAWFDDLGSVSLRDPNNNIITLADWCTSGNPGNNFSTPLVVDTVIVAEPGTYCLLADMYNESSVAMGFRLEGSITSLNIGVESDLCCTPPTGTITGTKFLDENCNSERDYFPGNSVGDVGLPGWTIQIFDAAGGLVATAVTDALGRYSVSGLDPGQYTVVEVNQPGWIQSVPVGGGGYTVTLNDYDIITDIDFGNCEETCNVSLDPIFDANAGGDCCWSLNYDNPGTLSLSYLGLELLDNNGFLTYNTSTPPSGTNFLTYSPTQVSFAGNDPTTGQLPTGSIPGFFDFCVENAVSIPQRIAVSWYDAMFSAVCTDTIFLDCPTQPVDSFTCLYPIAQDTLSCDSTDTYQMGLTLYNPLHQDGFTVELVKFTPAAGAGYTVSPSAVFPPGGIAPGDQFDVTVSISGAMPGDTVCYLVSAHDSLEIICCAEYEVCVVVPDCSPCELVDASLCPIGGGDGSGACCADDPLSLPWLQDIISDCEEAPCGWEVSCCTNDGVPVIVVGPAADCPDFPTSFYDCEGNLLAESGGTAGGDGLPVTDCELIYQCLDGDERIPDGCCYALKLDNDYEDDYFTSVEVKITTPGVTFSSIDYPFGNGWIFSHVTFGSHLRWTYLNGPGVPTGDTELMDFCLQGLNGPANLDICWMVGDSIACRDSIEVRCEDDDCAVVVNEGVDCSPGGGYVYTFDIANYSGLDVHEISFIDTTGGGYGVLGTVLFPGGVPHGGIASGFFNFTLPAPAPDSLCFLIVMRHQLPSGVSIICCNIEHCIELLDCDPLCDCGTFEDYLDDIQEGFTVNIDCPDAVLVPAAAEPCDSVRWTIIDEQGNNEVFTTAGDAPLVYEFPAPGGYVVCMLIFRYDDQGELCFDPANDFCLDVFVDCPPQPCIDPEQPTGNPCSAVFDPVCGCDGVEYGNDCEAFEAGVTSWTPGPCDNVGCIDPNQPTGNSCIDVFDPVCGCDGVEYGNECEAFESGVTTWDPGPCNTPADNPEEVGLVVYPVPAVQELQVVFPYRGRYTLTISGPTRGALSTQTVKADGHTAQPVDISQLLPGVYWISAQHERTGQVLTTRFVKGDTQR